MKKIEFDKNFDFGTASSGPQSEGAFNKKHESVWDYWYKNDKNRFFDHVGPEKTSNVYNFYETDVKIMKEMKLKSFRTSIQWTRLIKDFYTGEPDPEGVEFYNKYIDCMIENDIEPVINLFHFDTPMDLEQDFGGFKSRKMIDLYEKYAKTAFELFGDRVKRWISFNEPIAHTRGAYLNDKGYPNERSGKSYVQANFNILLAHVKAKKIHDNMLENSDFSIVLDLLPAIPRSNNEGDVYAAKVYDLFFNGIFMDPCVKGEYSEEYFAILEKHDIMFEYESGDFELIKNNTVKTVGINYYQPFRVKQKDYLPNPAVVFTPDYYYEEYIMPNRRMNKYRGWEINPKSIYDIAKKVQEEYGNIRWFISENGMGVENEERFINSDGIIDDSYRIEFIKEHLYWLHKAIEEGSNCFGYHLWTFVDNWSWTNAYKNRYGYVALDYTTSKRTIKKSGYWIKEVIMNNGFEYTE